MKILKEKNGDPVSQEGPLYVRGIYSALDHPCRKNKCHSDIETIFDEMYPPRICFKYSPLSYVKIGRHSRPITSTVSHDFELERSYITLYGADIITVNRLELHSS